LSLVDHWWGEKRSRFLSESSSLPSSLSRSSLEREPPTSSLLRQGRLRRLSRLAATSEHSSDSPPVVVTDPSCSPHFVESLQQRRCSHQSLPNCTQGIGMAIMKNVSPSESVTTQPSPRPPDDRRRAAGEWSSSPTTSWVSEAQRAGRICPTGGMCPRIRPSERSSSTVIQDALDAMYTFFEESSRGEMDSVGSSDRG
jgi:hypothetical protein